MKISGLFLTVIFYGLAFVLGALGTYSWLEKQFFLPLGGEAETVYFEVDKNQTLKTIAKNLEQRGIIRKWWTVYALNYLESSDRAKKIFPGEYAFSAKQSAKDVLESLLSGKVYYRKLTIPEGLTVADYPALLAKTGLVTEDEAATAIYNSYLARSLGIPADTFEGYLFPETYNFTKPDNAEKMIRTMVEEGRKRLDTEIPDFIPRAVDIGLTPRQIITLASIIEKETSVAEERAIVSSVFHNRLRIGMPLQSDPTVIYGIEDYNGNITKEHLKDNSNIFNTYQHTGLPPGPICNPGIESIKAALFPADTDYLYFVATGEGGKHAFSSSYAEHQKYVNQYQRNKP